MRTLARNRQKMFFSLQVGEQPVYQLDENGEKIISYVDEEGNIYYQETGEKEIIYSEPQEFWANISSNLNEMHMKAWGIDQSSIYCEIVASKGALNLEVGAVVWKKSPIKYKADNPSQIAPNSADYTVMGIMDEWMHEDWYLLKKNNVDANV